MKTALVTGSTQGIGRAIGIELLKQGYEVYFNGRSANSMDKIEDILNFFPGAHYIKMDLSTVENCELLINVLKDIDVLVWNVGTTDRTPFLDVEVKEWNKVFEANVDAPFFFIRAMYHKIKPGGRIILISSVLGIEAKSRSISYGVSKAAINMMVPYLAKEFANRKVTVNAIAPGFIDTGWHDGKTKEQIEKIESECLAKRLGRPEEIAKVAAAIVDNEFINGQIIRVDGGYNI